MIVTLTGPSGVGKGCLTAQMQSELGATVIPWTTTRPARPDDASTNNRRFVTWEEFDLMQSRGLLIGVQNLHGQKYGLERTLLGMTDRETTYICEINSANVLALFPLLYRRFSIALVTDDFQLLKERIRKREPNIGNVELSDRLETAIKEVGLVRANASLFHLQINVDICHESTVASIAIEAIRKGAGK